MNLVSRCAGDGVVEAGKAGFGLELNECFCAEGASCRRRGTCFSDYLRFDYCLIFTFHLLGRQ